MDVWTASGESFGTEHFAHADLGDRRRTRRLVEVADAIVAQPVGSLPQRLTTNAQIEALYHLLGCPDVTHASVTASHFHQMRHRLAQADDYLLVVHDTTELDYTAHRRVSGLGQIGNGSRRGWLCHNSLLVDPRTGQTQGLVGQLLHCRPVKDIQQPVRTAKEHRDDRDRESRLWMRGVEGLPSSRYVVDVFDRGGDTFELLEHEAGSGRTFVARSTYDRCVAGGFEGTGKLHACGRQFPVCGGYEVLVQGAWVERGGKKKGARKTRVYRSERLAQLVYASGPVSLKAPTSHRGHHSDADLRLWLVHVFEVETPSGQEPVEWFLLTNHACDDPAEAQRVIEWYTRRWVIEEYHKGLKTGCQIEEIQMRSRESLEPMIGLLSITTLALLQLRDLSRDPSTRDQLASEFVPWPVLTILATWYRAQYTKKQIPATAAWTLRDFVQALARLGGHLNRRCDGDPGWQTLWRGWPKFQLLVQLQLKNQQQCAAG